MLIDNPRYQAPAARSPLTSTQRAALRTALQDALAAWPAAEPTIAIHELVVVIRQAVAGTIPPAAFDGADVAQALVALGYTIRR
jgi:hypothetical protein